MVKNPNTRSGALMSAATLEWKNTSRAVSAPDLAQGGELTLVKRRNQRVGPRRTNVVLTAARRTLPVSVLPRLSRSRPPAMSRAAATRFALAVLRHTQSSLQSAASMSSGLRVPRRQLSSPVSMTGSWAGSHR